MAVQLTNSFLVFPDPTNLYTAQVSLANSSGIITPVIVSNFFVGPLTGTVSTINIFKSGKVAYQLKPEVSATMGSNVWGIIVQPTSGSAPFALEWLDDITQGTSVRVNLIPIAQPKPNPKHPKEPQPLVPEIVCIDSAVYLGISGPSDLQAVVTYVNDDGVLVKTGMQKYPNAIDTVTGAITTFNLLTSNAGSEWGVTTPVKSSEGFPLVLSGSLSQPYIVIYGPTDPPVSVKLNKTA